MTLAAGALSQVGVGSTTAQLSSAVATGGTGPYTYQWYRSTTTGFSPGGGNIIAGATALTLADSGLIPNTNYFYKVVATDTGNSNVTANSAQLSVVTAAQSLNPNQFAQVPLSGQLDEKFNWNSIPCLVDLTQTTAPIYAGQPVKIVDSAGGVPKVVACAASTDECFGFANYSFINTQFPAGAPLEVSLSGNVIYLYATGAIARGAQVQLDVPNNGVAQKVGSSGANILGWALDKATAQGQLIRVMLQTPSYAFA